MLGLKVVCPASAYDAKGLIKSAEIRDNNTVLFLSTNSFTAASRRNCPLPTTPVPIGEARVVPKAAM